MGNEIKIPNIEVLEYIKSRYIYRNGLIDGPNKQNVGYTHYRGPNKKPYKRVDIQIYGVRYRVYRSHLAWFLCNGAWPIMEIDHIDRNTLNDLYENLTIVTHSEQQMNKDNYKYGFEVDRTKDGKFRVRNKKTKQYIGRYSSRKEAYEAINNYINKGGLVEE